MGYVSGNCSQIDIELFTKYIHKYASDYHIYIRTLKTLTYVIKLLFADIMEKVSGVSPNNS